MAPSMDMELNGAAAFDGSNTAIALFIQFIYFFQSKGPFPGTNASALSYTRAASVWHRDTAVHFCAF